MMRKILSTKQIREADHATIEREPIASSDLMERAAKACVVWLLDKYPKTRPFKVFAGVGNNGGDALVISRRLLQAGYNVETFILRYSEKFSADCQVNLDRLSEMNHEVKYIFEEEQIPAISSETVVVDGLFGTGLNRPIEGFAALCIEQINASIADVISIDIPSGMFADKPTQTNSAVINAVHTLTFQVPKLSFLLPGSEEFIGKWTVIPIGLNPQYLRDAESPYSILDGIKDLSYLIQRGKFDHKGVFGHALIVAGSYGKMGACVLASKACLRSGAGKLTAHIPRIGYNIVQATVPEAMVQVDDYIEYIGDVIDVSHYQSIGIGPGIGTQKKTRRALKQLLQNSKASIVIDADALNIVAIEEGALKWLPKNAILTPHVGEFDRLVGKSENAFERLDKLRNFAQKHQVFVLLKGANSALATPAGDIIFNKTGNPGMATAGSGDVLTGIITGLLAQKIEPKEAALIGMFLHGAAGDLGIKKNGQHSLIASDIIENLGPAFINCFSFE